MRGIYLHLYSRKQGRSGALSQCFRRHCVARYRAFACPVALKPVGAWIDAIVGRFYLYVERVPEPRRFVIGK